MKRGAFILLEGVDRCGKTTQAKRLVESLTKGGHPTVFMRFPDRDTAIGSQIDAYLRNAADLDDHAVHLLFSANRWEKRAALLEALESGKNVVMDRYAFSGVAFSSAKPGLSVEWCAEPDAGLPMPDVLLFMELSPERAATRGGFGEERYENPAFQEAVRGAFAALQQRMAGVVGGGEGWWCNVDAWGSVEEVGGRVEAAVAPILKAVASGAVPLRALWDGKELERGGKAVGSQ